MKELLFSKLDNRKCDIKVVDCDKLIYSQLEDKLGVKKENSIFVANIKKNALAIKELTGIEAVLGRKIVVDNMYLEEENVIIDDSVHIDTEIMNMLLENISEDSNIIVLGDVNCTGIDSNAFNVCKEYIESKNKDIEIIRSQEAINDRGNKGSYFIKINSAKKGE